MFSELPDFPFAALRWRSFHNLPPEPVVVNKVAAGTWAESVGFIGGSFGCKKSPVPGFRDVSEKQGVMKSPGEEILALNDEDVASMTSSSAAHQLATNDA